MFYRNYMKRFLDFILSLCALIILIPIFLIISMLIKLDSTGPVLFTQNRVGKNRNLFKIYKFRTMRIDTPKETPTHQLENAFKWITPTGSFLRKTSLDELPQLINILKGEMAIVGPRPALWNQFDLIKLRSENGSYAIRPGLTGWAQVNGRDELEISKKVKYDDEYEKKISFFFDLKCIFLTISKVFKQDGVIEGNKALSSPLSEEGKK